MTEEYKPVIGKNVIETLTLGMYDDSRFIYREYIQNAADQIDIAVELKILSDKNEGHIAITIDPDKRSIVIEDNATGIESDRVLEFLGDVARSSKDSEKRKGFRGIGRLGGLGYCEKLIFETSHWKEATKSIVTLNATQLRRIIADKNIDVDASSVISAITSVDWLDEKKKEHYFKVKLENVTNQELLNAETVKSYLSLVAPVPFHEDFSFQKNIHDYFDKNNIPIDEYNVCKIVVNKERIYKAYFEHIVDKDYETISKIVGVDFFKLKNWDDELIAIGWYGISDLLNKKMSMNNIERGFRIKKHNITIGNEHTLNRFFGADRFNHHYVGEIHVIGSGFIPNARRDYFNDSKTVDSFESGLREQFRTLTKLSYTCSDIHSRLRDILHFKTLEKQFNEKRFFSRDAKDLAKKDLLRAKATALRAKKALDSIKEKAIFYSALKVLYESIIGDQDISIGPETTEKREKNERYPVDEILKLESEQRELILNIFRILDDNLSKQISETLKRKIVELIADK